MRILVEPKNALVQQYQKFFHFDDVELDLHRRRARRRRRRGAQARYRRAWAAGHPRRRAARGHVRAAVAQRRRALPRRPRGRAQRHDAHPRHRRRIPPQRVARSATVRPTRAADRGPMALTATVADRSSQYQTDRAGVASGEAGGEAAVGVLDAEPHAEAFGEHGSVRVSRRARRDRPPCAARARG